MPKRKNRSRLLRLSFVEERKRRQRGESPLQFWCVKPTGDYWADCEMGTRLGLEYLAAQEGSGSFLQWIVQDMPRKFTGVEVGFLTILAHAAGAGRWQAHQVAAHWEEKAHERQHLIGHEIGFSSEQ